MGAFLSLVGNMHGVDRPDIGRYRAGLAAETKQNDFYGVVRQSIKAIPLVGERCDYHVVEIVITFAVCGVDLAEGLRCLLLVQIYDEGQE